MLRLTAPYLIPWLLRLGPLRRPEMTWSLPHSPTVALTFDDGPGCHTAELLDVLAAEKIRATFFVLGNRCRRHPDLVRRMHHEGHTLGLHGLEHVPFTRLTAKALVDVWEGERALLGKIVPELPPVTLCRPPFGYAGAREIRLAREHGLKIIQMTCMPGRHVLWPPGWEEPSGLMARRVACEIRPGGIITLHDGENLGWNDRVFTQTEVAETTRQVVNAVRQRGLDFGTIPA